jgi:phosphatidylglycerophosphate synthase
MNGLCLLLYYTLDCMDGKQARRTHSSSPLGQLFDNGVDCLANLSHVRLLTTLISSSTSSTSSSSSNIALYFQIPMQLGFFQAQWEEVYTGKLTHAAGNVGTTEILYGMALWSLASGIGLVPVTVYDTPVPESLQQMLESYSIVSRFIISDNTATTIDDYDDDAAAIYRVRHLILLLWVYGFAVLSLLSLGRAVQCLPRHLYGTALSKLISPLVACVVGFCIATKQMSTITRLACWHWGSYCAF